MSEPHIGLVAVDGGARAAISPLAAYPGFDYIELDTSGFSTTHEAFASGVYRALIVGTSDSSSGRQVERTVLRMAKDAGLPTIVIEDYPGNYHHAEDNRVDVVVVDGEFARNLILAKQLMRSPEIWVCRPVRYDSLRQRSQEMRDHVSKRWRADGERLVLWAGQPETEDSLETMKRILPSLSSVQDVKLLFKAHPRDAGYLAGEYHDLLGSADVDFFDITADTLESCMEYAPRIVLTQFSSVGVEAGFYGIPTVNILYPDVGGRRLAGKKGYNIPPWVSDGGAFVVTDAAGQDKVLDAAINNEMERASVIKRFDSYFSSAVPAGPALAERIKQYCAGWKKVRSGDTV